MIGALRWTGEVERHLGAYVVPYALERTHQNDKSSFHQPVSFMHVAAANASKSFVVVASRIPHTQQKEPTTRRQSASIAMIIIVMLPDLQLLVAVVQHSLER